MEQNRTRTKKLEKRKDKMTVFSHNAYVMRRMIFLCLEQIRNKEIKKAPEEILRSLVISGADNGILLHLVNSFMIMIYE
jgi:hypothetical protein